MGACGQKTKSFYGYLKRIFWEKVSIINVLYKTFIHSYIYFTLVANTGKYYRYWIHIKLHTKLRTFKIE